MTVTDLIAEATEAENSFWFICALTVVKQTDATITLHLIINSELFVQIYFSERSGRFSLALVGSTGRLYGRDREYGVWHKHPFDDPTHHEPTAEGMSPHPIMQFMSEVEEILVSNELL